MVSFRAFVAALCVSMVCQNAFCFVQRHTDSLRWHSCNAAFYRKSISTHRKMQNALRSFRASVQVPDALRAQYTSAMVGRITWFASQGIISSWVASDRPINVATFLRSVLQTLSSGSTERSQLPGQAAALEALDRSLESIAKSIAARSNFKSSLNDEQLTAFWKENLSRIRDLLEQDLRNIAAGVYSFPKVARTLADARFMKGTLHAHAAGIMHEEIARTRARVDQARAAKTCARRRRIRCDVTPGK